MRVNSRVRVRVRVRIRVGVRVRNMVRVRDVFVYIRKGNNKDLFLPSCLALVVLSYSCLLV